MPPLSQQEKETKKRHKNLEIIHNGIKSDWSRGAITKWSDVSSLIYISPETLAKELSYPNLKLALEDSTKELERQINAQANSLKEGEEAIGYKLFQESKTRNATLSDSNDRVNSKLSTTEDETNKEEKAQAPLHSSNGASGSYSSDLATTTNQTTDNSAKELEVVFNEANDYGWKPSSRFSSKGFIFWYQKKASSEILDKILKKGYRGILLLAGTGTGKTYIMGDVVAKLIDANFAEGKTMSHIQYLMLSRTTIVEQSANVFKTTFGIKQEEDIDIINVEQLRSNKGKFWIKRETVVEGGEEVEKFIWKKGIQPVFIEFDESQAAKNKTSTQHKIMCSYAELPANNFILHSSATPFTKVEEAKCFALSTHLDISHHGFPKGTLLNKDNWEKYARIVSHPSAPDERNEAAIGRLMKDLEPYVVRVKGVRKQFNETNQVEKITFQSQDEADYYFQAWKRFLREKKKYEAGETSEHPFTILLKFSMAAEMCRKNILAERLYDSNKRGKAAVMGCKWKGTIIAVSMILMQKFGVKREDISLIWGGGQTQLNKKQIAKKKIMAKADELKMVGMDIDQLLKDIDLDEVEDRELVNIPTEYKLGQQTLKSREEEKIRFQSGRSNYAMFTYKSGGVGLSLHHTDEYTEFKCRRKKSGYVVEEDIPLVPTKQREGFFAPTYSPIELVQALGRLPRLTSLSETLQTLLFYTGTIEDDIADIVSLGLRCLSTVVQMREPWADVIIGAKTKEEIINQRKDYKDDEKGQIIETEEGDEE